MTESLLGVQEHLAKNRFFDQGPERATALTGKLKLLGESIGDRKIPIVGNHLGQPEDVQLDGAHP